MNNFLTTSKRMYVNARKYLCLEPPPIVKDTPSSVKPQKVENYKLRQRKQVRFVENMKTTPIDSLETPTRMNIIWENKPVDSLTDPKVWGPSYWFTLHNGAINYPLNPTPRVRELMKYRIQAIPYEIPCEECKLHAQAFIQSRKGQLDKIVSSRDDLFDFYVDFHNKVNERYNKPILSYEDARRIWSGDGVSIKCSFIEYK